MKRAMIVLTVTALFIGYTIGARESNSEIIKDCSENGRAILSSEVEINCSLK
jgi:hypothetical protein